MKTEPLPIAIVGLGFGRHIVNDLQTPELKEMFPIAALSDLDPKRTGPIAQATGAPVLDFDEILKREDLPVIGLFTGPAGRAELIRKAIRAGKDVMTTKPFERDPDAALAVLEEASRLGRIVHMNSPAPDLAPDLAQIQAWKEEFGLGSPVAAQASAWVRYNEKADGTWMDDPALCPVAPIFRIGIYLINDLVEIFGEGREAYVMASRLNTGRPTPDHAQLAIRFKNGGLATILASFCIGDGRPYRNSLILNFEHGTVYRNVGARAGDVISLIAMRGEEPLSKEASFKSISGHYQWEEFHRAVHSGSLPPADYPSKVVAGLRIVEAMAQAEHSSAPVRLAS